LDLEKETQAWIGRNAARLWLLGILSSLALNLYKLQSIFDQRQIHLRQLITGGAGSLSVSGMAERFAGMDRETKRVVQAAVQDMIDVILPLSLTGFIEVSPGIVGLAGTVTSLMGCFSLWPASAPKDKFE